MIEIFFRFYCHRARKSTRFRTPLQQIGEAQSWQEFASRQRRVDALPGRRTVRDVRDTELKGYGVRVMPSGPKRYFIHSQHQGLRVWKIVGDAGAMTEAEARNRARSMLAALRDGRDAADA